MKSRLATSFLVVMFVLGGFSLADAAIIYSQPDNLADISNSTSQWTWQPIIATSTPSGMGFNGLLESLRVRVSAVGTGGTAVATITCYTEQTLTTPCPAWASASSTESVSVTGSQVDVLFENFESNGNINLDLDANRFYVFNVSMPGAFAFPRGIEGSGVANHCHFSPFTPGDFTCTGIPYTYLTVRDGDYPEDFTASYIIDINSPTPSETTLTTDVTFDYDYWNTGYEGFDKAGVILNNLSAGQNVVVPEQAITLTGEANFSQSMVLQASTTYLFRPYLRNSGTDEKVYGSPVVFYVVNNPGGQSLIPEFDDATSSANVLFSQFFQIPTMVFSRFPFSWYVEIGEILKGLDATTTTAQASISLDFAGVSTTTDDILGNQPLVLFSSSTVSQYMPEGSLDLIKLLISSVLWIGFASNVFFTITRTYD